jgi:hypothetical protein
VLDIDPFGGDTLADPYPMRATLRDPAPVVCLERYRIWAMARYEQVVVDAGADGSEVGIEFGGTRAAGLDDPDQQQREPAENDIGTDPVRDAWIDQPQVEPGHGGDPPT